MTQSSIPAAPFKSKGEAFFPRERPSSVRNIDSGLRGFFRREILPEPQSPKEIANTKLLLSVQRGGNDFAGVQHALMLGADPDARESEFQATALILAAISDDVKSMKLLLQYGADPKLKDALEMDAEEWARRERSSGALALLRENGLLKSQQKE